MFHSHMATYFTPRDLVVWTSTCKQHHNDDAYRLAYAHEHIGTLLPILNHDVKRAIAIDYLIRIVKTTCTDRPGSLAWFQALINTITYKVSIRYVHDCFFKHDSRLLYSLDVPSTFYWNFLVHKYHYVKFKTYDFRVYKPKRLKRHHANWLPDRTYRQPCFAR